MIEAVRPVGVHLSPTGYLRLDTPLARRWHRSYLETPYRTYQSLSTPRTPPDLSSLAQLSPRTSVQNNDRLLLNLLQWSRLALITFEQSQGHSPAAHAEAVFTWASWPAHEPFADEVRRWWPGELPLPEPPEVVHIEVPSPPRDVPYPAVGGLLDTWM